MSVAASELEQFRAGVAGVLQNTHLSKEERAVALAVAFLIEMKHRRGEVEPGGWVSVDERHIAGICGDFQFPPISQTGLQRWLRRTNYGRGVTPDAIGAEVAGLIAWYLHPNLAGLWREFIGDGGDA